MLELDGASRMFSWAIKSRNGNNNHSNHSNNVSNTSRKHIKGCSDNRNWKAECHQDSTVQLETHKQTKDYTDATDFTNMTEH